MVLVPLRAGLLDPQRAKGQGKHDGERRGLLLNFLLLLTRNQIKKWWL